MINSSSAMEYIDYLVAGNHNIPIAILSPQRFIECPPKAIQKSRNGILSHDNSKINLFFDSFCEGRFINSVSNCWEVSNMEDFAYVKRQLLTKPSFLYIEIKVRYSENHVVVHKQATIVKPIILYISPTHPVVSAQLRPHFDECEKHLQEGKRFSLEIRLENIVRKWCESVLDEAQLALDSSSRKLTAFGSTICITNFSQRWNICYNPVAWWFPLIWFVGPPYLLYRSIMSKDYQCNLEGYSTLLKDIQEPRNLAHCPILTE